jgi:hypothetical protein
MEEDNCVSTLEYVAAIQDTYEKQMDEHKAIYERQMKELKELNNQIITTLQMYFNQQMEAKNKEIESLKSENDVLKSRIDVHNVSTKCLCLQ